MLHPPLIPPRLTPEPSGRPSTRQRIRELELALNGTRAQAAATASLLEQNLRDASDGVLLVNHNQQVVLANEELCRLFGLQVPTGNWRGQPAALAETQLRAALADPQSFDQLRGPRTTSEQPLALATGQVVQLRWQPLAEVLGGGYLLRATPLAPAEVPQPIHTASAVDSRQEQAAGTGAEPSEEPADATARNKDLLLATLSHEIRTSLTGVLGLSELLARTVLDNGQQQLVTAMRNSGQLLEGLLDDVLELSKMNNGPRELAQQPFELGQTVQAALSSLACQATQKGLDFQIIPEARPFPYPWVLGDARRLSQVLVNLVSNALKFTERGHVHVRARLLADTADSLTVQLAIADSGIGIAPAHQPFIFDYFTQASPAASEHYGGVGLGLGICRDLVRQMGGTLTVASQPERGSTFTLELSLPKAHPQATQPTSSAGSLTGLRVLLVDDNELNRCVTQLLLKHWGVALQEAANGAEAIAQVSTQPFDVILLDVQLPGMGGAEVLRQLRAHPDPERAATPVIAFTAHALPTDRAHYLRSGFNDYLAKPFAEATLHQKLMACLPVPAAPTAVLDLSYLHQQVPGCKDLIDKVIESFLRSAPHKLAQLRAATAAANWEVVGRLAHDLKSNLQVLGIQGIEASVMLLLMPNPPAPTSRGPRARALALAAQQLADTLEAALYELAKHRP